MSYRSGSESAVFRALYLIVRKHKRWVSAGEVRDTGITHKVDAPSSLGGWTVFDFTDRTKRFLDRLVKKGVIIHKKVGRRHYYNLR